MKKAFYVFLSLMMCLFTSCQKDEDIVDEPKPEPESQPMTVKESVYETTDDYVDLGFDGFMIATKNLGAKNPEDAGDYFAWGETAPKKVYSSDTYKLQTSTLYYKDGGYLQSQDDTATVILGEGWRMPTGQEIKFLYDSYSTDILDCKSRATLRNGVFGYQLIGPNGNSIFIPYTGYMKDGELVTWDYNTYLWCSDSGKGKALKVFSIDMTGVSYYYSVERYYGLPIRPVKEKKAESDTLFLRYNVLDRNIEQAQQLLTTINVADYSAGTYQTLDKAYQHAVEMRAFAKENDGQKKHSYLGLINEENKVLQDSINLASRNLCLAIVDLQPLPKASDIKAVDLGLSVRWASANLGARSETENGYYISWGELTSKSGGQYGWEHYQLCKDNNNSQFTKYVTDRKWGEVDGKTRLDLDDDAAHAFLGGDWRIPTTEEFQELADKCTFESVRLNGYTVMKATGPNGNAIYFPHAGTTSVVDEIYCWTSDLIPAANNHAVCYRIDTFWGTVFKTWENRCTGLTIRAVCP